MEFPTGWGNNQAPNQTPQYGPPRAKKTFVLCFDGTGNKFSNTEGDSNILKIFRMLDASNAAQLHYYQVSKNPFALSTIIHCNEVSYHSILYQLENINRCLT